MRRVLFRIAATVLGALIFWAFANGGFNAMTPPERAMSLGMGIVFLLYGLTGDGVADAVLERLTGSTARSRPRCRQPESLDDDAPCNDYSSAENEK